MVWVKGPNYGGPHTEGATHGSSSGSTGVNTQAMAPPGRSVTGPHDLSPQVAPPQMNTDDRQSNQEPSTDPNINLVDELQALLDDTKTQETTVVDEIPGQVVSNDDRIWNLATQAASSNRGYELSFEGKELMKKGVMPGSDEWIRTFGLPQIIGTTSKYYDKEGRIMGSGDPVTTGIRHGGKTTDYMDEYGQIIEGGKPILTGQGKYLMDRYDNPTGSYQDQVAEYYEMREAEQQGQNDPGGYYNYGGGGGSDGDYGYGYGYSGNDDPLARGYQRAKFGPGTLQEQVNQNFMRLSGLQKKRGGIVSLLELR